MSKLLIKLAYFILKRYGDFTYPPCYFKGVKYQPIGFEYNYEQGEIKRLKIYCMRDIDNERNRKSL